MAGRGGGWEGMSDAEMVRFHIGQRPVPSSATTTNCFRSADMDWTAYCLTTVLRLKALMSTFQRPNTLVNIRNTQHICPTTGLAIPQASLPNGSNRPAKTTQAIPKRLVGSWIF